MTLRAADRELRDVFLDEAGEALTQAGNRLLALDRGFDRVVVEDVFRPIHSVKGNCAFFGLMLTKSLAHELESVLDHLRHGRLVLAPPTVSLLLESVDALRRLVAEVRAGHSEDELRSAVEALRERLRHAAGDASVADGADLLRSVQIVEEHVIRSGGGTAAVRQALTTLITHVRSALPAPSDDAPQRRADGVHPALAGLRSFVAQSLISEPSASEIDSASGMIRALAEAWSGRGAAGDLSRELRDTWELTIESAGFSEVVRDWLVHQVELLAAAVPSAEAVPAPEQPPAVPAHGEVEKTMRIAESRIDTFLRLVGELVMLGDSLHYLDRRVRALADSDRVSRDFGHVVKGFAHLSDQLQHAVMAIRTVPVRPILGKAPRLVRDLSETLKKPLRVEVAGDDIEIDKSMIEKIDAALVHVVRNSCDHGIEPLLVRRSAGKPDSGTIRVSVTETARAVTFEIADDGGGLDLQRIRSKAERLGLVSAQAHLDQEQIIALIFSSGLSTSATINEVSGRGVGLDAVRRDIQSIGGTIHVETRSGIGTSFFIAVPKRVTTQILSGYLVRVADRPFVIPVEQIRETLSMSDAQLVPVMGGRAQMLMRHQHPLRVIDLTRLLELPPGAQRVVVVAEYQGQRVAIAVDEVIGLQKVVVRPLPGLPRCALLGGAALLGDGRIAMILSLDALITDGAAHVLNA